MPITIPPNLGAAQIDAAGNWTFGASVLRATSPRVTSQISDANGVAILALSPAASAVNQLALANAAAGGRPTLSATGADANVGIRCETKGTGEFQIYRPGASGGFRFLPDSGSGSNGIAYLGNTHFVGASTDQNTIRMSILADQQRINLGAGIALRWHNDTHPASGAADTGISRSAAGVIEINNGTAGTFRDLKLRHIELVDGNLVLGTATGTKIGTSTSQKLGFFNAPPIVQPVGGAATASMVYGALERDMLQRAYDALRTLGLMS